MELSGVERIQRAGRAAKVEVTPTAVALKDGLRIQRAGRAAEVEVTPTAVALNDGLYLCSSISKSVSYF